MELALNSKGFCELSENELFEVDGGLILSTLLWVVGDVAAVTGALFMAMGQTEGVLLAYAGIAAIIGGFLALPLI